MGVCLSTSDWIYQMLICMNIWFLFVCHQTRQGMTLPAVEDMRAAIYNCLPSALWGRCVCINVSESVCAYGKLEWWTAVVLNRAKGSTAYDGLHAYVCLCGCRRLKVRVGRWHVTLDKGEIRGYDWLFSHVTDCESSQLETITCRWVTRSVFAPPFHSPFSLQLPLIHISSLFVSNFMSFWNFSVCHSQANWLSLALLFITFMPSQSSFFKYIIVYILCLLHPLNCITKTVRKKMNCQ